VLANERGGICSVSDVPCIADDDCAGGPTDVCEGGANIDDPTAPVSAILTTLTLMPCAEDFENQLWNEVTVQFEITNEFEQKLSASTTVGCWKSFFLHEVDSLNNPERSVFSYATLGSTVAQTRISPVTGEGGVLGVASVLRTDADGNEARVALNIHTEGDRYSSTEGAVVDEIVLPEQ